MPIEMLEMVIKANITDDKAQPQNGSPAAEQGRPPIDIQTLTEDIFAQVIAYLEHKSER